MTKTLQNTFDHPAVARNVKNFKKNYIFDHPAVAPAEGMRFQGMREQRGNRLD